MNLGVVRWPHFLQLHDVLSCDIYLTHFEAVPQLVLQHIIQFLTDVLPQRLQVHIALLYMVVLPESRNNVIELV